MIEAAVLANMHRAFKGSDFEQIERAKRILDMVQEPGFKDYPKPEIIPATMNLGLVDLSPINARLLELTRASHPDPVTYKLFRQEIWPESPDDQFKQSLTQAVNRFNKKLKDADPPLRLKNVRGIGYRLATV